MIIGPIVIVAWTSRFFMNVDGVNTIYRRRGFLSVLSGAYLYHVRSRILYKLRIPSKADPTRNQIAFAGYVGHGIHNIHVKTCCGIHVSVYGKGK